jgi:hypothetical protein
MKKLKYPSISTAKAQLLQDICPNMFPIDTAGKKLDLSRELTAKPELVEKLVSFDILDLIVLFY